MNSPVASQPTLAAASSSAPAAVFGEDLDGRHSGDFQRLQRLLEHAGGFQLVFAGCLSFAYRQALIDRIDVRHPSAVIVVDLVPLGRSTTRSTSPSAVLDELRWPPTIGLQPQPDRTRQRSVWRCTSSASKRLAEIGDYLRTIGEPGGPDADLIDEALRIRSKLPVSDQIEQSLGRSEAALAHAKAAGEAFRGIDDRGSAAVAVRREGGRDILASRGQLADPSPRSASPRFYDPPPPAARQLDEALALHEQRLPVAERLGDINSLAHIRYSMASLRLQRGEHESGGLQRIHDDLVAAFAISRQRGRPDGIGWDRPTVGAGAGDGRRARGGAGRPDAGRGGFREARQRRWPGAGARLAGSHRRYLIAAAQPAQAPGVAPPR
jgi:hypothetical protein